jgi:hypothetical protein
VAAGKRSPAEKRVYAFKIITCTKDQAGLKMVEKILEWVGGLKPDASNVDLIVCVACCLAMWGTMSRVEQFSEPEGKSKRHTMTGGELRFWLREARYVWGVEALVPLVLELGVSAVTEIDFCKLSGKIAGSWKHFSTS